MERLQSVLALQTQISLASIPLVDGSQSAVNSSGEIELRATYIQASGDEDQLKKVLPPKFGQKGMFTHDLELLLDSGEIDIAVHSLKDMPAELPDQYELAVLKRCSPYDVLITRDNKYSFYTLPSDAAIGTSSARRSAITSSLRPDLRVEPLRGNVDTRIKKLNEGVVDGIILAMAGLERLELTDLVTEVLTSSEFIPAPAQGVIALQYRRDNVLARDLCLLLDDPKTKIAIFTERAFVAEIGATCGTPIAVFAELIANENIDQGFTLWLHVGCYAPDGRDKVIFSKTMIIDNLEVNQDKLLRFAKEQAKYALGLGVVELMKGEAEEYY